MPELAPRTPVIPRESGVSSTPRLRGSIASASGILDHPLSRAMTRKAPVTTASVSDDGMSDTAASSKADLRAAALAARDALSEKQRAAAAQAIAKRGLPVEIAPGAVVAGYSPIRSELDPTPLMQKLAAQGRAAGAAGHHRARPVAAIPGLACRRQVAAGIARHSRAVAGRGRNRARHRAGAAGGLRPDRPPHRLWRRALRPHAGASAQIEGFCGDRPRLRGARKSQAVPALQHDVPLDYVLTETKVFDFRSS